ncbi:ABC transporter permease [Rhodococcus sp. T2V]|uniref:MlaE family ABC transporter permease n=1 Tax=Rhodococcus sp. T2V TaxID=3034164 RepID=UPI0023E2B519|nr:ABC transporter permease [Rhodococcus sp. T2V]MDF3303931.1 ABC transporter permease [Rhodococcus sp. T2V]
MVVSTRWPAAHWVRARVRQPLELMTGLGREFTFYGSVIAGVPLAVVKYWRHIMRQIGDISFGGATLLAGGGAIGVVFAMSAVAATQVGIEGLRGLDLLGMGSLSGLLSAILNTRELAPVIASIALAAKVGTGFTAQLGAMRISEEISALDAMAIPSLPFLASTRLVSCLVCVVPLYVVGLLSSYLASRLVIVTFSGQSAGTYDYYFHLMLTPTDVAYSFVKAIVFATIIALVHCSYGYHAYGGPEGVGRAAGRALRTSILAIGIVDLLLTLTLWGLVPSAPALGLP